MVLPNGDGGTRMTLGMMQGLAIEGSKDAEIRDAAVSVIQAAGVRPHDFLGQLRALFNHVRSLTFVNDPVGVQIVQSPRKTLELGAGNCVQRAVYLAALLRAIGIPAILKFRVIASDRRRPASFSHTYVVARFAGREIPLDPTYPENRMGWQYPRPFRSGEVPA